MCSSDLFVLTKNDELYGCYSKNGIKHTSLSQGDVIKCGEYYNFQKPKTIQTGTHCSLSDIFDIVQKQKVAVANQQLQTIQYWQSYFTNGKWLEL